MQRLVTHVLKEMSLINGQPSKCSIEATAPILDTTILQVLDHRSEEPISTGRLASYCLQTVCQENELGRFCGWNLL